MHGKEKDSFFSRKQDQLILNIRGIDTSWVGSSVGGVKKLPDPLTEIFYRLLLG